MHFLLSPLSFCYFLHFLTIELSNRKFAKNKDPFVDVEKISCS